MQTKIEWLFKETGQNRNRNRTFILNLETMNLFICLYAKFISYIIYHNIICVKSSLLSSLCTYSRTRISCTCPPRSSCSRTSANSIIILLLFDDVEFQYFSSIMIFQCLERKSNSSLKLIASKELTEHLASSVALRTNWVVKNR